MAGNILRAKAALSKRQLKTAIREIESISDRCVQQVLHPWLCEARKRLMVEQAAAVLASLAACAPQ